MELFQNDHEIQLTDLTTAEEKFNRMSEQGPYDEKIAFSYAWHLLSWSSKSKLSIDHHKAVDILEQLKKLAYTDHEKCIYLYYLAVAEYQQDHNTKAGKWITELLKIKPNHMNGKKLKKMIDDKAFNKSMWVGAGVAAGALLLAFLKR